MTITRNNIQKYLGMTTDYYSPGKVKPSMVEYIGKLLADIPEYMKGESETPAAHQAFNVAEDATNMYQTDADLYHHFVVQLM